MDLSIGIRQHVNFFPQGGPQPIAFDFQIVMRLQIQPEPLGGCEISRQPQRGVGGNGSCAFYDFVDPTRRNIDLPGKPVLAHAKRFFSTALIVAYRDGIVERVVIRAKSKGTALETRSPVGSRKKRLLRESLLQFDRSLQYPHSDAIGSIRSPRSGVRYVGWIVALGMVELEVNRSFTGRYEAMAPR